MNTAAQVSERIALAEIRTNLGQRPFAWPLEPGKGADGFRLLIASDRRTRDRAYALAHQVYSAHGYARPGLGRLVWPYDAEPTTLTLLVEDARGTAVATATIAYDAPSGLPSDALFPAEMAALRGADRRLLEVCRLCIADAHQGSRVILERLVNVLFIHAVRIGAADDFVIEVHPRRAAWYIRKLLFEPVGTERACPSVGGQPTVLLRCRREHYGRLVGRPGIVDDRALLYGGFYGWLEEDLLAEALRRHHRPMSGAEAASFGLSPVTPARAGGR